MMTLRGLAEEILDYLKNHPQAQDTVEGIAKWWLLEQGKREKSTAVKKALAELEARGMVSQCIGQDGRIYYAAKRRRKRVAPNP